MCAASPYGSGLPRHGDREIDDVPAGCEVPEFFEHARDVIRTGHLAEPRPQSSRIHGLTPHDLTDHAAATAICRHSGGVLFFQHLFLAVAV